MKITLQRIQRSVVAVVALMSAVWAEPVFDTLAELSVGSGYYKDIVLNLAHGEMWPYDPIRFVGCVSPTIADMDGDGVKDLLTGVMDAGTALFLRNHGTNAKPEYDAPKFLHEGDGDTSLLYMPPT